MSNEPIHPTHNHDGEPVAMELVMPFVICTSQGGPFEDDAFVAGWQAGSIDMKLATLQVMQVDEFADTVSTSVLPQLDLIAMRRGFTTEATASEVEGWSYWTARRA